MLSFIRNPGYKISSNALKAIEREYGFQFPKPLKEFYISHNEATISPVDFCIADAEFNIARFIYPIVTCNNQISISVLLEMEKKRKWFGESRIPFASDWGDDLYCWETETGRVFLFYPDDEEPISISETIGEFFSIIEQSFRKGEKEQ